MIRFGFGYDVHRLVEGRALVLGGVSIPHHAGLSGHSDADVLTHAIIDALLGAAALGDIGAHFPDSDEQYRNANSLRLLRAVVDEVKAAGYEVVNVDSTVVLERPRLRPYIEEIRQLLADTIGIALAQVSVKATTSEGMGFVGGGDGAAAYAVCALRQHMHEP